MDEYLETVSTSHSADQHNAGAAAQPSLVHQQIAGALAQPSQPAQHQHHPQQPLVIHHQQQQNQPI